MAWTLVLNAENLNFINNFDNMLKRPTKDSMLTS